MAYTPPVGGAPLDLGGVPGTPALCLGCREALPSAAVAAHTVAPHAAVHVDLHFSASVTARTAAPGAQVRVAPHFSAAVAARTAAPRAAVRLGPSFSALVAARTASPSAAVGIYSSSSIATAVAARTASPSAHATLVYDPNLLSATHTVVSSAWTAARSTLAPAMLRFAGAAPAAGSAHTRWSQAPPLAGAVHDRWKSALHATGSGSARWQAGEGLRLTTRTAWRDAPALRNSSDDAWRDGALAGGQVGVSWRGLPLVTAPLVEHWRDGTLLTSSLLERFSDGELLIQGLIEHWRDAALLLYVARYPPPPPPPPPWRPDWDARLCLTCDSAGNATLRIGYLPCREVRRICRRRSYIVIHDIWIVRLPDRYPIAASSLSIILDADSWAWAWSANLLGRETLAAVLPSTEGEPVTLEASIDGYIWHLVVEDWTEDRSFGERRVRVQGRGLSAWLGAPYELPVSGVLAEDRTIQQAMVERLPLDPAWILTWRDGMPDWLLPTGSWSWQNTTPIQAIHAAAQSMGMVVLPGMAERTLAVQPRYPVLPWDYAGADPDLIVPDSAIVRLGRRQATTAQANAVYVYGAEVGGILARVYRAGTAGDRLAPEVSTPLLTHADAARLLGSRLLAGQERQPEVRSVTLPLGGVFPLATIGSLLAVEVESNEHRGVVNAVGVEVQGGEKLTVRQTLTIGEDTPNVWATWRRLLPDAPLLAGTVSVAHGDGTVSVALVGGGTIRVRGDGAANDRVWVRDGRVDGSAPAMAGYDLEV